MDYKFLKDIKIIYKKKQTHHSFFFIDLFNIYEDKESKEKDDRWVAIYHTELEKWIVTNDIESILNSDVEDVEIIGFADNLDAIMFVIWEHQVSLGMEKTILDEIREFKNKLNKNNKNDWEWAKDKYTGDKIYKNLTFMGGSLGTSPYKWE